MPSPSQRAFLDRLKSANLSTILIAFAYQKIVRLLPTTPSGCAMALDKQDVFTLRLGDDTSTSETCLKELRKLQEKLSEVHAGSHEVLISACTPEPKWGMPSKKGWVR
jgi:hypothetical protein